MPSRAPRRCGKCTAIAIDQGRCEDHPIVPWERPSANSRALSRSDRWTFKKDVLRTANHTCAMCGAEATEADHIIEIAAGGAARDSAGNGQALCGPCHSKKTLATRRARAERLKYTTG